MPSRFNWHIYFDFFTLMCFTIDQTSSSVSSLFWATLWTLLLLLAWLFLILVSLVYLHLLSTKSKSSLKVCAVLHLNCLRLTFQSNLTVTDRQVSHNPWFWCRLELLLLQRGQVALSVHATSSIKSVSVSASFQLQFLVNLVVRLVLHPPILVIYYTLAYYIHRTE